MSIVVSGDQMLPAPSDVWRAVFARTKIGTRIRISDLTPEALQDAFLEAAGEVMAESIDSGSAVYMCSPGQTCWNAIGGADLVATTDMAHRAVAVCGGSTDHVVSVVHLEYHSEISIIPKRDIAQFKPRALLDPALFRQSSYSESEFTIDYVPLNMSRRVHRYGRASHDDIGSFKFDVIRTIVKGGIASIEHVFSLDDDTVFFLKAPAAESIARIATLSPPHGVELFLLFAAHALDEMFVANIDHQWLWAYNETRYALRQLRALAQVVEP